MAVETDEFIIDDVVWNYIESQEITGNRSRPPPRKGGLKSASIICKACGHSWVACQHGNGQFLSHMGGVTFNCPSCSVVGKVAAQALG